QRGYSGIPFQAGSGMWPSHSSRATPGRRWCSIAWLSLSRRSMSLAAQHLSALLEGQGYHFAAGVALEVDLGADALGDEDILIDGCDFDRPLLRTLHEELGTGGEDAQRKGGRERIVAVEVLELRFGRRPFARSRRGRVDALGLQHRLTLKQSEGVC